METPSESSNSNRKRPRQDDELCSPSATAAGQQEDTQVDPPAAARCSPPPPKRRDEVEQRFRKFFEGDYQYWPTVTSYRALLDKEETPLAKLRREYDEAQKKAEGSQRAADDQNHQEPTEVQTTEQPEEMSSAVISSGTEAQLRSAVEDARKALRDVERSASSNFGWETLRLAKFPVNFAVVDHNNNCRLPKAEVVVLSLFHAGLLRPHCSLRTASNTSSEQGETASCNDNRRVFDVAFALRLTLLLGEGRGEEHIGIEVNESYYRSATRPPPNMPCMLASGFARVTERDVSGDAEEEVRVVASNCRMHTMRSHALCPCPWEHKHKITPHSDNWAFYPPEKVDQFFERGLPVALYFFESRPDTDWDAELRNVVSDPYCYFLFCKDVPAHFLRYLLSRNPKHSVRTETKIAFAAAFGAERLLKQLLPEATPTEDGQVFSIDSIGLDVLSLSAAAAGGIPWVIDSRLRLRALSDGSLGATDDEMDLALQRAVESGSRLAVRTLLKHHEELPDEAFRVDRRCSLYRAISGGRADILGELLCFAAQQLKTGGRTFKFKASGEEDPSDEHSSIKLDEVLFNMAYTGDFDTMTAFLEAHRNGVFGQKLSEFEDFFLGLSFLKMPAWQACLIAALFHRFPELGYRSYSVDDGQDLLELAACLGNAALLKFLLDEGSMDPNGPTPLPEGRYPPLYRAVRRGWNGCVRLLLQDPRVKVDLPDEDVYGNPLFDGEFDEEILRAFYEDGRIDVIAPLVEMTRLADDSGSSCWPLAEQAFEANPVPPV